jgi:hypothetical protein
MPSPVRDRDVELIGVAGLHRDVEPDPMNPAREARDNLPANRFHDPQLLRTRSLAAPAVRQQPAASVTGKKAAPQPGAAGQSLLLTGQPMMTRDG